MNKYIVYKHTSPKGKIYIGITSQDPEKRWLNGKGYKRNSIFYNAIEKYGWENIKHEILFENLTKEEAEQKEIELISKYKSNERNFGYNIDNGGHINRFSEASKKKMSLSHKGKKAWNKGISIGVGENNNFYGHKHTQETKNKISKANKGKVRTDDFKERVSRTAKKTWAEKIKNGYKFTNEHKENLSKALKGKTSANKGKKMSDLQKAKIKLAHIGLKQSQETINKRVKKIIKPIVSINIKNYEKKEYESIASASKYLDIPSSNICRCLKNANATAKGYKFEYKEK